MIQETEKIDFGHSLIIWEHQIENLKLRDSNWKELIKQPKESKFEYQKLRIKFTTNLVPDSASIFMDVPMKFWKLQTI